MPKLTRRQLLELWWVLPVTATLGTLGTMLHYAARIVLGNQRAGPTKYQGGPRVPIARLADLSGAFAAREFTYQGTPCIVMRLPEATPSSLKVESAHFAAWSRVCTHLGCSVNPLQDLEATALTYNYRPTHPVLGCPCHFSVFDPLRQGESVFGRAVLPLPRVQLEARAGTLYAVGIEPPPQAFVN
ncbi:Rieske 2Fe-2S domain-containing protein [Deinococcus peraridilitoris]|uniref:Rieske Fe-S protein n=1 Tax=Deinococcus peraridilitoris (strain DSM 19664 / LMG 22246 / CIP 109416 / KR-200) TaxID=937777 RepID=K9ZYU7_DEIPD|nr:ubiquinol-cytochrome c reductase iron-sulfur subunit [Deinococcus peraridilitoris]AFZ66379.1 Rieske Fe-S protein [Deinococcus peraridilitoris DSM 19664]